ncbi:MAG: hypothetical protein PHC64_06795 [Candidatus Gastranaerophilales bacterium]|nr:hypothetical protein [Candidatus Gastranaerophilales bacterium]
MSKIGLLTLLQQDVNDITGLINYQEYGLTIDEMKKQARGIILNLQEHLEKLAEN